MGVEKYDLKKIKISNNEIENFFNDNGFEINSNKELEKFLEICKNGLNNINTLKFIFIIIIQLF